MWDTKMLLVMGERVFKETVMSLSFRVAEGAGGDII